ncbi:hypothetical protein CEXT_601821 [Caerostris extrusa]|uniref:Uncharacterized protein n=1 Tax=Caerostris extrusa TaxID=172846 RepID=A0AAV4MNE4_CAEEX|nr:hypothetical protein CEXT_601821 [Caerostris extrusa]
MVDLVIKDSWPSYGLTTMPNCRCSEDAIRSELLRGREGSSFAVALLDAFPSMFKMLWSNLAAMMFLSNGTVVLSNKTLLFEVSLIGLSSNEELVFWNMSCLCNRILSAIGEAKKSEKDITSLLNFCGQSLKIDPTEEVEHLLDVFGSV